MEEKKKKKSTLTNINVAIKASRPHQSWVQGINPISAGYDHHVSAAVESCGDNRHSLSEIQQLRNCAERQ